jgi:ArsR family transcriptional regulator
MNKKQLQEFLNAISDPVRFKLLSNIFQAYLLYNRSDKPAYRGNCVTELRKATNLKQPTISHHLKILEDARIVIPERQGKWIHYLPNLEYIDRFKEELSAFFSFEKPKQKHLEVIQFDADESKLKALIELLTNHGIKLRHFTQRQATFSVYLEDKDSGDMFILLFNQDTKLLTIRLLGKSNMIAATQLVSLIKKYLPTLN